MQLPIKAIFFDIGGTLRVSHREEGLELSKIQQIIAILGENCSPEEFIERIRIRQKAYRRWCKPNFIELSEAELWIRFLLPEYPVEFIRENAIKFNQLWRESRKKLLLPDMESTIRALADRGYKLGLISNTTSSVEGHQILAETGLTNLFSSVILSAAFGRRKPHSSIFLEAARQAGVRPEECAYVGDRPSRDLIGARQSNYGQVVIINTDGYSSYENDPDDYAPEKDTGLMMQPDYFIARLEQLLEIFPAINQQKSNQNTESDNSISLYDAGLSTMWWNKEVDSAEAFFSKGRKLGFARFELDHQVPPEVLDLIDLIRYHIGSLHDPCPAIIPNKQLELEDRVITSLDETRRSFAVDVVKTTIESAYKLGVRSVVIHAGRVAGDHSPDNYLREMYKQGLRDSPEYKAQLACVLADRLERGKPHLAALLKSFDSIISFVAETGLTLGIENRFHHYELPVFEELEILMNTFHQSWVGWQFDVGHLQVESVLGLLSFQDWLNRFSPRMIGIHLHDVRGIIDHYPPGLGDVNFTELAKFIPAAALRTLEVRKDTTINQLQAGLEILTVGGLIKRLN